MSPTPPLAQQRSDDGGFGVLGEQTSVPEKYDPSVLFPVPRDRARRAFGLAGAASLPFEGEDVWNAYELSWLGPNGVPRRHVLELRMDLGSPNLVESKSLKLYLNSLNNQRFESDAALLSTIQNDLKNVLGGWWIGVELALHGHEHAGSVSARVPPADTFECIDAALDGAELSPAVLEGSAKDGPRHLKLAPGADAEPAVTERLVCHQLRTLCPITRQPDWGSVYVEYAGPRLDRAALLTYICSLRNTVLLHEQTVEAIWLAIHGAAQPTELRVTGRFARRGGIDINPTRQMRAADAVKADAAAAPPPPH